MSKHAIVGFNGSTAVIDYDEQTYTICIDSAGKGSRKRTTALLSAWNENDGLIWYDDYDTFGEAYLRVLDTLAAQGGVISLDDTVSLKRWASEIEVK